MRQGRFALVLVATVAAVGALAAPAYADAYAWGTANPLAQFGDVGGHVIGVQAALVAKGYYRCGIACTVDGNFGSNTRFEVELYQTNHPPLVSDGDVGPKTWNSLQTGLLHQSGHPDYLLNPSGRTTVFDGVPVNGSCTWNTFIDTDAYPSTFNARDDYRMDLTTIHKQSYSGLPACQPGPG